MKHTVLVSLSVPSRHGRSRSRPFRAGLGVLVGLSLPGSAFAQAAGDVIPNRYIVQLTAGASAAGVAAGHGLAPDFVYTKVVNGFAGFVPPGRLRALANDPRVVSLVPDRVVEAIAKPGGGGGGTVGQQVPAGVQHIGAAPGGMSVKGVDVGVAIVDTGLDFAHPDLQPFPNAFFTAFGGSAQDDNGHGTHVGGIVAARDNTRDVVGVAPAASLYAVKVLDASGSGSDANVLAGLNWVAATIGDTTIVPPIRVVNLSLGRKGTVDDNPSLRAAVQNLTRQNITVVVAAGNDPTLEVSQQVPAAYPEVLAVASSTASDGTSARRGVLPVAADTASYFTSDGASPTGTGVGGVTISAPGEEKENISAGGLLSSTGILSTKLGGGTIRMSGTSMASPHVAGVVALLWEQALSADVPYSLSPEMARARIRDGAAQRATPPLLPLASPAAKYTFDGEFEGILSAPGALAP